MKRLLVAGALLVTSYFTLASELTSLYGRYEGEPAFTPVAGTGALKLIKTYSYIDPIGGRWDAPAGTIIDGASIPRVIWSLVGTPWSADYRQAAVIHDVACKKRDRPWEVVHITFYYSMLAAGVSETRAKILYSAVNNFGPRWGVSAKGEPYDQASREMSNTDLQSIVANVDLLQTEGKNLSEHIQLSVLQHPERITLAELQRLYAFQRVSGSNKNLLAKEEHSSKYNLATGTVKWFDYLKGIGYITPDKEGEDLFVHFSAIKSAGFKSLTRGQRVQFEVTQGPKGEQASNIEVTEEN